MDERLLIETPTDNVFIGRVMTIPSTNQSYIRLGNSWVPFASSSAISTMGRVTIFMSGVLIDYKKGSLVIDDIINQEEDTCSFIIEDTAGTLKPEVGEEVFVYYRQTAGADPTLVFGGRVNIAPQTRIGIGTYQYEVQCSDFTQDLRRLPILASYTDTLPGDIIKNIISTYVPYVGTLFVEDGIIIDDISFNYKFASEIIQQIADLIGYTWYVDYERNIHFFARTTNTAPFELNESASSGVYRNLTVEVDKSQLKNSQMVRGGSEFSILQTQLRVADGEQTSFGVDDTPFSPITVEVDTGGGFVSKTLGIENIDTGKDFVVNVAEKTIKNQDYDGGNPLGAGDVIRIKYKLKIPVFGVADDEPSIQAMKDIEGGDGVYNGALIIDENLDTRELALRVAQAEIDAFSNPLITGTFETEEVGYKSGQLLTVNISTRAINSTYLITNVSALSMGLGLFVYTVTFATKLKGLTELITFLYSKSVGTFKRTDELLARFKVAPDETVTVTDSGLTESRRNMTTNPYVYSNDAGTTPDKGQYNLAEYG